MSEFNPVFTPIKSPPDRKDFTVLQAGICAADLPKVVANSKHRGIIRDHGNFGLCVSHSGRSLSVSLKNATLLNNNHNFSTFWIATQLEVAHGT